MSFAHRFFLMLMICMPVAGWAGAEGKADAPASLNLGVVSDENTRDIEDMLLVHLQKNAAFRFLERTHLPKITEELLLQEFLGKARWESCDVLILLNSFSSTGAAKERLLIVRFISTHTMQTMGLWVYPLEGADPSTLASMLAARIEPVLTTKGALTERKAVSLSLLRAETPALNAITESATYLLGAQIQNQSNLSLIERWNVRDPGFEQWLRKTAPVNLKAPDMVVEGSLAEINGRTGLRLSIDGKTGTFVEGGADHSLTPAAATAARAIAEAAGMNGLGTAVNALEFKRFESDARWFWKWRSFRQAAAVADTAIYLGSTNPETHYIRALAYMRFPRSWSYASSLRYADTPTAEALQNSLYGLECFMETSSPAALAKAGERWKHLIYAEDMLCRAGELLQGLYLSEHDLPGTPTDRSRLREMAKKLAEQTLSHAVKYEKDRRHYATYLEHIDNDPSRQLPAILASYGGFMVDDPEELIGLYVGAFDQAALRGGSTDNGIPADMFPLRSSGAQFPWVVDWEGRPPGDAFFNRFVKALAGHQRVEVRVPAYLIPVRYSPDKRSANEAAYYTAWLRWLATRLANEKESLAAKPTKYTFQLLACIGGVMEDMRRMKGVGFPEADWRACIAGWIEMAPKNSSEEYAGDTERYLNYLMEASMKASVTAISSSAAPTQEQLVEIYRYFMLAPPPLPAEVRKARTAAYQERVRAVAARQPAATAPRQSTVTVNETARALPRRSVLAKGAESKGGRFSPELLFADQSWGKPFSFAQGDGGTLWFLFWYADYGSDHKVLTFAQTDAALTTILRTVRIDHHNASMMSWSPALFVVQDGAFYWIAHDRFYRLMPGAKSPESLPLAKMQWAQIWQAGGRLWVTGRPGLIYEYVVAEHRLRMISSSMRTPALNALDARDDYGVSGIFEHEGGVYAWIDDRQIYQYDAASAEWREVHGVRKHLRANQTYPADLLLKAIGMGIRVESQDNSVSVLALDPGFGGLLRSDYRRYPAVIRAPDGERIYASEMKPAATTEHALWVLFQSQASGVSLGGWQRRTGAPLNYPLQFPQMNFPQTLHALPDGFLFNASDGLFYLSRGSMSAPK